MNYRIFSSYYQLSLDGKVEAIRCIDVDHPILVPHPLDEGEGVVFKCIICSYKVTPGLDLATKMSIRVKRAYNNGTH
jgi:hypothetical protein